MIESARTWRLLRSLKASSHASPEALAALQAIMLRGAVAHAYANVPFYRRRWDADGVDPSAVHAAGDVDHLPVIASAEAREAIERGELLASGVDLADTATFPTSGASGRRLEVPRRAVEQRLWRAVALRMWLEHGYRWRDGTVHFDAQAGPAHPLQRFGISRTTWISPQLPVAEQVGRLVEAAPDVVVGTPTVLRRVCKALEAEPSSLSRPRLVFAQGEVLDLGTARLVERVLGVVPVSVYGLTEVGYVAWQCERREGFHLNAETCLVEVLEDGRPVGPGELGTIVVTTLRARTMPLIRYDTGDLAITATVPCPCGRTLPLLRSIEGRAQDALVLADGRRVTSRSVVDHLAGTSDPDGYRLIEEAPARFRLHVDPRAESAPGAAARRLAQLLDGAEIETVAGLPRTRDGELKTRAVISAAQSLPAATS